MKRQTLRHPKTLALAAQLNVDRPTAIGLLTLLWDFTAESAPRGDVGKWPDGAIAAACDWKRDAALFIQALVDCRWLDKNDTHRLVIHDWPNHCENWIRAIVAKCGGWLECYGVLSDGLKTPSYDGELSGGLPAGAKPDLNRTGPKPTPKPTPKPDRTGPAGMPVGFLESWDSENWRKARQLAQTAVRKLWPNRQSKLKPEDHNLLGKAAYLAVTRLSEAWFQDALDETMRASARSRIAVFKTCLWKRPRREGLDLNELLDSIEIPPKPAAEGKPGAEMIGKNVGAMPKEAGPK